MQTLVDVTDFGEAAETAPQAPAAPAVAPGTPNPSNAVAPPTVDWMGTLQIMAPRLAVLALVGAVIGYAVKKVG